jgi:hypothetical protein
VCCRYGVFKVRAVERRSFKTQQQAMSRSTLFLGELGSPTIYDPWFHNLWVPRFTDHQGAERPQE